MLNKEVHHRNLFLALFIIVAFLSFLLVRPYLSFFIISLIFAYLLSPLQHRLKSLVKSADVAAYIITIGVLLLLIIPSVFLVKLILLESSQIYRSDTIAKLTELVTSSLSPQYQNYVQQVAATSSSSLLASISTFLLSLPQKIVGLLIAFLVLFFALRDGHKIEEMFRRYLPVEQRFKDRIIKHFKETIDAVTYSTIVVAVLQGIIAAIGYALFGIQTPIVWGVITAVAAVLPFIGPMVVWLPLSIYLYIYVSHASGIGLALYGGILLSLLLEIFFKNMMISRKGKIHTIIAVVGVIGGLPLFGVSGIILGPFLLTIFMLFLEVLFGDEHEAQG